MTISFYERLKAFWNEWPLDILGQARARQTTLDVLIVVSEQIKDHMM